MEPRRLAQHVLIEGTPERVRQTTREILEIMMPGGGYMAGASHDWILPETPVENVLAMFEAIRVSGAYGRSCGAVGPTVSGSVVHGSRLKQRESEV